MDRSCIWIKYGSNIDHQRKATEADTRIIATKSAWIKYGSNMDQIWIKYRSNMDRSCIWIKYGSIMNQIWINMDQI